MNANIRKIDHFYNTKDWLRRNKVYYTEFKQFNYTHMLGLPQRATVGTKLISIKAFIKLNRLLT